MTATIDKEDVLRHHIARQLAEGLKTEVEPRCDTQEDVQQVITRLRCFSPHDVEGRLVAAGFTDHPVMHEDIEQVCDTCMYYLVHRRYCELPELQLPVEPNWSCRLWRI